MDFRQARQRLPEGRKDSPQGRPETESDRVRERSLLPGRHGGLSAIRYCLWAPMPLVHKPGDEQDSCACPCFGVSTLGSSSEGRGQESPLLQPGLGLGVGERRRWSRPGAQASEHTDAPAPGAQLLPHTHASC